MMFFECFVNIVSVVLGRKPVQRDSGCRCVR
jgi:hypothetical protein